MRKTVFGVWLISLLIFAANRAHAQCDCGGYPYEKNSSRSSPYLTAYEELENSEVVFIGEVIKRKKLVIPEKHEYEYIITYKVKKAWKKQLAETIDVREGRCLPGFEKGEEVLVYAIFDDNKLFHPYCSRTRLLSKARGDLKEFEGRGLEPQELKKPGKNR